MSYFTAVIHFILLCLLSSCASKTQKLYKQDPGLYSYVFGSATTSKIHAKDFEDAYVTPASCQKAVTALIAFKTLGPEYKYATKLYAGSFKGAQNSIVLSFSGDPTFTSQDLYSLLERYKGKRVKLILDASKFQTSDYSPNLMIDDVGSNYASPISSMIIDENLISVIAKPTEAGAPASILVEPNYPFVSGAVTNLEESCVKASWKGDVIEVIGNINVQDEAFEREIAPKQIDPYILSKVHSVMKSLTISGSVQVVRDSNALPKNLILLDTLESIPLKLIINTALKRSDNLVFDSIYLTIVNMQKEAPISDWNQGSQIMKDLIKQHFDVNMQGSIIVDGSGLSRYNRLTPMSLFKILQKGYSSQDFIDSLAKPGEEGSTLEKEIILNPNIRAKNGIMTSISCLCGYKIGADARAFVIVKNSFGLSKCQAAKGIYEFVNANVGKN
jgi:D-alanyl-D-alanine carboxypeptidase/D-alanyl-D-alanine-endopeptidase (penicillin-binding protein 4)